MHLIFATALAAEPELNRADLGVNAGLAATRSSTGNHRVDPALGLWARKGFGAAFGELELGFVTNADPVPGGTLRRNVYRSALLVGWRGGLRPMHVGFAAGLAASVVTGNDVMALQPGVRFRSDLHVPVGDRSMLVFHTGLTSRGRGADADVGLGWGLRW